MFLGTIDIGIDLGTASVLVYQKGKGIVLREPSVVAIEKKTGDVLAVGESAHRMLGKTPEEIEAIRPLHNGVISNFRLTEIMLQHFIEKSVGSLSPFCTLRMIICVPSSVTEVEKRSVEQAARQSGANYVRLVEEPLAAAIGAGLEIQKPYGSMVVDIGGGTTDIAVLSMGSCVVSRTVKTAGDHFDQALIRYIRQKFNILIGEVTAERVKMTVGAVSARPAPLTMDITGRSLLTGLPKTVTISSAETQEAYELQTQRILDQVRSLLEETPPEIASDIFERGITLTGGGSLIYGLDERISSYAQIECRLADDAVSCVALGTARILEEPGAFRGIPRSKRKITPDYE